jgi:hypothetical protein
VLFLIHGLSDVEGTSGLGQRTIELVRLAMKGLVGKSQEYGGEIDRRMRTASLTTADWVWVPA